MASTLDSFRSGAVGFIDWLNVFAAPEYELPPDALPREVEHKPDESPLSTAEQDRNEREYVTRGVVHKREIGEENGEVDKRQEEPAQLAIRLPSRGQPPHVKSEDEQGVDDKKQASYRPTFY